ncbi:GDSL-type esterase/lipase family protein [Pedobacter alpinus]|uniref:GDSL-type esterase/lipase family protein n=1 Tax=Pedobacter alpinus TaxID=1590643 RepID=A0ABW5TM81_9SPHI
MKKINLLIMLLFVAFLSEAQVKHRFDNAMVDFKKLDQQNKTPKGGILFIGSSSFTFWKALENTFASYQPINRGFGGSTLAEVIHYADDILYPYQPRQVVIYCGENDIAEGNSPEITVDRFKILFNLTRKHLPNALISFVSMKPSVAREKMMPEFSYTNQLIERFMAAQPNTSYINVYDAMLQENGKPLTDIFVADNLHMNAKGYDIWIKIITPYLLKNN